MYRVTRCSEVVDLVLLDDGEHPVVPGDLVVEVLVVHRPTKRADQVVVVSDDNQLEVAAAGRVPAAVAGAVD